MLVETVGEYFYPDVLVGCAEPLLVDPKPRSLVNPEVLIEVLSDSTERTDRGDKWSAYRSIASLADYVMVGSPTLRVLRDAGATTLGNGVVLDLDRLYRLVPDLSDQARK